MLVYLAFEGVVRTAAGFATGEKLATSPLALVAAAQGGLERLHAKWELGPPVVDEIVRGTPKQDFDFKVNSCRPKADWNPYVTIEFEDRFYQMFREERVSKPRPFVYYLRNNPVGRLVVVIRHYKPEDVLQPSPDRWKSAQNPH